MEEHFCQAIAVHCGDWRFRKPLFDHLSSQCSGGVDGAPAPGGVKELVEMGAESHSLGQLQIYNSLHHPHEFILIQHEDCGAYGGSKAFKNSDEELSFQTGQLLKAEEVLKEYFPKCTTRRFFTKLSGEVVEV